MKTKICIKCGKELSTEYFHISKINKDGYRGECKECLNEDSKLRYEKTKSGVIERQRQYQIENKDKFNDYQSQYTQNHKDKIREYGSQYYELYKGKINNRNCQYYKNHTLQFRVRDQRHRAKKNLLPATLTEEQWRNIKQQFNNKCAYCGKEKSLAQEHFIALSKGGEYTHNNIIPACKTCNSSKLDKDFFKWYPKYKYYSKKREKFLLTYLGYQNKYQQLALAI